jgi:hypothetical protein
MLKRTDQISVVLNLLSALMQRLIGQVIKISRLRPLSLNPCDANTLAQMYQYHHSAFERDVHLDP